MTIAGECIELNVQDLTVDGTAGLWGVNVTDTKAITSWTNVEIIGSTYAWIEAVGSCANNSGKHSWFSSRIRAVGSARNGTTRAYGASCAQSWFWGSEIIAEPPANASASSFALEAHDAEVHLYGSDVRLILKQGINATGFGPSGHYLIAALKGSEIHIHGTGLDVIHDGTGTADMLYADADPASHFHATASGFNIHVSGTGKVRRLAGPGRIEAPYTWGERTAAPLSVGALISRNGADRYTETDCQLNGNCSSGGTFPHDMVYRTACTGTGVNQGPWFDMTTKACMQ